MGSPDRVDPLVTEAMIEGIPVTAHREGPAALALRGIWERVVQEAIP